MMAERKQIPKKIRFEVFKRDSFKCQYCGRSAPDVILEVDHIIPVSEGGENSLINLITSCRDCNRGKGKKLLSDESIVAIQKKQLEDLNERRNQVELMALWQKEMMQQEELEVDMIDELISHNIGLNLSSSGRNNIAKRLREFGFLEVYEATKIAISQYCRSDDFDSLRQEFEFAFWKIGGICANRRREKRNKFGA